jgi:hypothetical protein
LTSKQHFYIFGISEQLAIRKSTISIYRVTSFFHFHMRIFNLQGFGAPDKPKKIKIKYAEIDFTSYYSFLRVRRDQFRQNCKKPTLVHSFWTINGSLDFFTETLGSRFLGPPIFFYPINLPISPLIKQKVMLEICRWLS